MKQPPMPASYRTGGRPRAPVNPRSIIVVVLIFLAAIFIVNNFVIHHRNRYESTADNITKAIAKNDMAPVEHAFNAIVRTQLRDRARVGQLSDLVNSKGSFKGSKEDTPAGSAPGYHHFIETFDKGTLVEKFQLDAEDKITRFHIGPSDTQ